MLMRHCRRAVDKISGHGGGFLSMMSSHEWIWNEAREVEAVCLLHDLAGVRLTMV
jgi:hypothetical protein